MKAIARTNLGNILVGTTVDYKFTVADDNCSKPCAGVKLHVSEIYGDLEVTPKTVTTDADGHASVKIKLLESAVGLCHVGFNFEKKGSSIPFGWEF